MDAASVWHQKLVETFLTSKAPLNVTVDNAPIETVKRMVALGLGVGFVPRMCVREEVAQRELAIIEVEGLREERSIYLVRRRATYAHAAQAFVQVALSFGKKAVTAPPVLSPAPSASLVLPASLRRQKPLGSRRPC